MYIRRFDLRIVFTFYAQDIPASRRGHQGRQLHVVHGMAEMLADGSSDDWACLCKGLSGRGGTAVPCGQCVNEPNLLVEQGRVGTAQRAQELGARSWGAGHLQDELVLCFCVGALARLACFIFISIKKPGCESSALIENQVP